MQWKKNGAGGGTGEKRLRFSQTVKKGINYQSQQILSLMFLKNVPMAPRFATSSLQVHIEERWVSWKSHKISDDAGKAINSI